MGIGYTSDYPQTPSGSKWITFDQNASYPNCITGGVAEGYVHDFRSFESTSGAPALLYCSRCGHVQKLALRKAGK